MLFDVQNFDEDVLAASQERPILVDFWAPWCGPCRALGPVLERLAAEQDGWALAKVNTDEHPGVSQRFGIRGIPAVKLFSEGEVIDEFTGAMPEHQLRRWLAEALPSEDKARLEAAQAALDAGNAEEAEALLREVLAAAPDDPDRSHAQILLARTLTFQTPAEAAALAEAAHFVSPALQQTKEATLTLARLQQLPREELPEASGRDAYAEAAAALRRQDFDAALSRLIEVVQVNRAYDDDGARKACVALFALLGAEHPAVKAHRRTFDMALY